MPTAAKFPLPPKIADILCEDNFLRYLDLCYVNLANNKLINGFKKPFYRYTIRQIDMIISLYNVLFV